MKKRRVSRTCSGSTSSTAEIPKESYNDSESVDLELQQHSVNEDYDVSNPESQIELVSRNDSAIAAETTVGDTESEDCEDYKQKLVDTMGELSSTQELLLKTANDLSETKKQQIETSRNK